MERRSSRWDTDLHGARTMLDAAVSLVLRLIGHPSMPVQTRQHAFLFFLAETRLRSGRTATLEELVPEILEPPMETVGALPVEIFLGHRLRVELAAELNTLIASPAFAAWREGQDLDVGRWMEPVEGKTPATIVSVAHLDDDERTLALGVVLEEVLEPGPGEDRAVREGVVDLAGAAGFGAGLFADGLRTAVMG
jgi:hypothetical protein